MKLIGRTFIAFLLFGVGPTQATTEPAVAWIRAMSDAMQNLDYRGSFVYLHDNQLESMLISHVRNQLGEKEHLLSLNGEAREVIRSDQHLTSVWPSSRTVVVESARKRPYSPLVIPGDIDSIRQLYDMSVVGRDRIAGSQTMIVHIKPRDQYRYGFQFWINTSNGLMMKANLLNEQHRVVEQVMFTSLDLLKKGDPFYADEQPEIDASYTQMRYASRASVGDSLSEPSWTVRNMPRGFRQEASLVRYDAESRLFHQLVFTDGLASLSIFIEPVSAQLQPGKSSMGAVNAFIRHVDDFLITAIGEVPAVTVETMANSMVYEKP